MGIQVTPEEILTSAQAAMAYVRAHSDGRARVLVVGEAGLVTAAQGEGLELGEDSADWVVAGLDRGFDYQKLARATRAILGGARFVASNADALLPIEGGDVLPGAGSIVAAIRAATGVQPVVVGKPEPAMFEAVLIKLGGLEAGEVAMIGDRLDTDIDGGRAAGLRTILVLTGVTTRALLSSATSVQPDAVVDDLASVSELLGW
jgi:HAD superfamily hydrolase (TIGR01450 family)